MSLTVHILHPATEDNLDTLRADLNPGIQLTTGEEVPVPAEYEILVAGRPTREFLTASDKLRAVVIPWAGAPEATRDLMVELPHLNLHNLHHNAATTGETALALLFAAAKFIVPHDRSLRRHDWTPRYQPNPSALLQGKTALMLGYGHIGQHVARVLQAMGLRILAVRRNPGAPAPEDIAAEIHAPDDLPGLLPQTDVLMASLPLTEETEGMISAEELSLLPEGSLLVNIGRGPVIEQEALYKALLDGPLYAAGVDVWYNYPPDPESRAHTPPGDFPFHELDNLVMSPHRGGGSRETNALRMTHLAALLNTAARGEPIPNRVDLQAGY